MATRASARQAALKAKEAITSFAEGSTSSKDSSGSKRKASSGKPMSPNKQRDIQHEEPKQEHTAGPSIGRFPEDTSKSEQRVHRDSIPGTSAPIDQSFPPAHKLGSFSSSPSESKDLPEVKPTPINPIMENVPGTHIPVDASIKNEQGIDSGVHKSQERERMVSSNILEKGPAQHQRYCSKLLRSPTYPAWSPIECKPRANGQRCTMSSIDAPKKKFPTSTKERDMAFVEKAGQSVKDLQEKFMASSTYKTATRGERTTEEAQPYAEGVYALMSTQKASHLAYELTIPAELGEIQDNFGLHRRGSWIVQSKNPQYPGPPLGQLPQNPDYPGSVLEKFGDLRWVPLKPEFIEYPNAQILMIGQGVDTLGKAATAEGNKAPGEAEPGQEIERLAEENEHRVESLKGDETVFQDLGLHAQNYRSLPTTWTST
ncbi:hypothetical protein N7528_008095 [Penicillium herquei]|nr:hypothetical protein N7528_008095 [Penicillium herquei]